MAKRKASGTSKPASSTRKSTSARRPIAKRAKKANTRKTGVKKAAKSAKRTVSAAKKARSAKSGTPTSGRKKAVASKKRAATKRTAKVSARKSRARRRDVAPFPTPPSSLDMNRRGSAARTGRDEMAEERADHATMTPSITGGDVDANVEDAYFTGDEAPGGDNPTPDQDIVDDIGRALGVEYQDNEELRGSDKVADRDKRRWELDPASSEDYRDRK